MSEHPPRPYKTKNVLTLAQRVNVINYSEANTDLRTAQIAEMFDCSYSQIRDILIRKDEIRKAYENNECLHPYNRALHKSVEMKTIKYIIMEWFMRCKFVGFNVDDNEILTMAEHTANLIQYNEFRQKIAKNKKKWLMSIRSAEASNQYKAYSMKLDDTPKTSFKIEDIIVDIRNSLPLIIQEKLNLIKSEFQLKLPNCTEENKAIFNWNDEIISLDSSESESEDVDVGVNEYKECHELFNVENHDKIGDREQQNNSFDENISIDNNEFITFTDFNETPLNETQHNNRRPGVGVGVIQSYEDALEEIKRLEEFALNQEDIKAINLICDLKSHFKNRILY